MISKEEKADYDRVYRERNNERLKAQKAEYFRRTYDPKKAAIERKKNMAKHVEYCRQPKYKAWKKEYDNRHRSSKFGDFSGAHQVLIELQREIRKQMPDRFERYAQSQRHGWNPVNQQRRRMRNGKLNCN